MTFLFGILGLIGGLALTPGYLRMRRYQAELRRVAAAYELAIDGSSATGNDRGRSLSIRLRLGRYLTATKLEGLPEGVLRAPARLSEVRPRNGAFGAWYVVKNGDQPEIFSLFSHDVVAAVMACNGWVSFDEGGIVLKSPASDVDLVGNIEQLAVLAERLNRQLALPVEERLLSMALNDRAPSTRLTAVTMLVEMGDEATLARLGSAVDHPDANVALAAAAQVGPGAIERVMTIMTDGSLPHSVRCKAIALVKDWGVWNVEVRQALDHPLRFGTGELLEAALELAAAHPKDMPTELLRTRLSSLGWRDRRRVKAALERHLDAHPAAGGLVLSRSEASDGTLGLAEVELGELNLVQ